MRTGIATPARRTTIRRRLRTVAAIAAVAALGAVISGCEDNSPVAAPTSTLPAAGPSAGTSTPTVPEYTTDLDLTDDEKKAVDGALVAFEGYIKTMNRVFSSGGEDMEGVDKYAADSSLEALESSANELKKNGEYMAGEYDYFDLRVDEVKLKQDEAGSNEVTLLYCSNDSNRAVVKLGEPLPSQSPQSLTIRHTATEKDSGWVITNQELWSKSCE